MIMKKFTLLLAAIGMSTMLMAQKPSTETSNYSLEGNINIDATNGVSWTAPSIRMRYFVNDTWAARVTLGLSSASTDDGAGNETSASTLGVGLGAEYHTAGTDRLSPFFSAGISFGSSKVEAGGVETTGSNFGFALGGGMDYYVYENVYMGLELGLGWQTTSSGDASTSGLNTAAFNNAFRIGWRF